jgi:AcrR family transcriptional regulator
LDAALDAFAEHGFEGATTTQIAARAGATQGLIYFYFPQGKEQLYTAAFDHQAEQTFRALDLEQLLVGEAPPEVTLRQVVERFLAVMGSKRCLSMTRVLWRTMANAPDGERLSAARRCGLAYIQRVINELADYLSAQAAEDMLHVADPHLTAQLIVGGMLMLLRSTGEELTEARRDLLASQIAGLYTHGLLPAGVQDG